MGRRRKVSKADGQLVLLFVVGFLLLGYVGMVYAAASESLPLRLLGSLGVVAWWGSVIGGYFAPAESGVTEFRRWVTGSRTVLWAAGLTSLGILMGWKGAEVRERELAAIEQKRIADAAREAEEARIRQERKAAEEAAARAFSQMPARAHIDAARLAMADGYDAKTKTGGNLEEAERQLRAVLSTAVEAAEVADLLGECRDRKDRLYVIGALDAAARGSRDEAQWQLEELSPGSKLLTANLQRQIKQRLDRAAAAESRKQRSEERERRRLERDSCGVRCCDGSCSPTCSYAHRGCCSHHGGVCG